MTVGTQNVTQANINNTIGNWAIQLKNIFADVVLLKTALDAIGSAGLIALGFSAGDATSVINTYNEINNLASVYYGNSYVAFGATINTGVVTANSAAHFGHNFDGTIGAAAGLGF